MPGTRAIDRFWGEFLGVPPERLSAPGIGVVAHAGLAGWSGAWLFVRGRSCIVSVPPQRRESVHAVVRQSARHLTLERARDPGFLRSLFGDDIAAVIGPSWLGQLEPERFRPVSDRGVRAVGPDDAEAVRALRAACAPADWQASGLDSASPDLLACFREGRIAALAGYRPRSEQAGDPCVIAHPAERGRGCASAVVSAVVERELARAGAHGPARAGAHGPARAGAHGRLLLYQTLRANAPAVALAERLGFAHYASHVAVRLGPGGKGA